MVDGTVREDDRDRKETQWEWDYVHHHLISTTRCSNRNTMPLKQHSLLLFSFCYFSDKIVLSSAVYSFRIGVLHDLAPEIKESGETKTVFFTNSFLFDSYKYKHQSMDHTINHQLIDRSMNLTANKGDEREDECEFFRRAKELVRPGAWFRFVSIVYADRKLIVFLWINCMCTLVVWGESLSGL